MTTLSASLSAMASIAASPGFPEGPKKRSRVLSSGEAYELPRMKRCRGDFAPSTGANDAMGDDDAKYTQRHVDYFEQVKQAEIARIRAEYEQFIMKKEVEFQQFRQEAARMQEHLQSQDRDLQRLQSENKLLKRAITIQNQQKEECLQENAMLKTLATQAADHIKKLEQSNYALRVHLQTSTSSMGDHSASNPDVY